MKKNNKPKLYFLLGFLLVNIFIWRTVFTEDRQGVLRVSFLDIEQGDAIFIEAPSGNQVLIDGGPNKIVLKKLAEIMPFYDRTIDAVIATHPDKDHIGGLVDVLKNYRIDFVMEPGVSSDTGAYQELEKIIAEKKLPRILARRGMSLNLGDGAHLNILFPDRNTDGWETNTASIVAKLVYGNNSFLLTGDSPIAIEKYLSMIDGKNLQSDVLKAGHHGSRTSTSESFANLVSPEYAVISAGKNNKYGHPHKEVLDILEKIKSRILKTYELGTISFSSDGENIRL
ncbi:MAG: MBL fold metallo-hydrolase [Patescibacteria group bacterium]|nr:MBL fold metallo-hydrolase [Patescibacteria group bacterium]MDE1988557.1 MBL fold metallo-hydrolase [Patescibacteria group bacterium]MDE2217929.1 MBL fold metallo-hydrolase [Patescibacteria group bacterium]